ncbi:MAG: guanylate kinase [Ruminococcus sp.]|nr:guanylate kinase [Ruminococcus sp.]
MKMSKGRLFIVSAPSGCGKGTILAEVFKDREVYYSVSCTTRKPREGEVDGVNYFFLSEEQFSQMIAEDGFLEYATFAEHSYGTPRKAVMEKLEQGIDTVLEIETNGAFQVKEKIPEAVMIFILPPSVRELDRRLRKRGTEDEETISKRVSEAEGEIKRSFEYDYVIMNDDLDPAIADFKEIIDNYADPDARAQGFRAENENIKKMIEEVLEK